MAKELEPKVIVGLEVGTSKVVAVVGEVLPDGVVNVLGVGSCQIGRASCRERV